MIASNNRGHRELIRDGVNGYLVDPDDIGAYSERLCMLLCSKELSTDDILKSITPFKDVCVQEELKKIYDLETIK